MSIPPVILKASSRHTATMIFLHGLGDNGFGWAAALNTIRPPFMKIVCPTANQIPVTCNGGMLMPAWYDIISIEDIGDKREDLEGVKMSSNNLNELITQEETQVPRNRIILGGFSQGGALALHNVLNNSSKPPLAGCIALSCYLPGNKNPIPDGSPKCKTSIFQCHGKLDEVVPFSRGLETWETLKSSVEKYQFKAFDDIGHEGSPKEMAEVRKFIDSVTPDLPSS